MGLVCREDRLFLVMSKLFPASCWFVEALWWVEGHPIILLSRLRISVSHTARQTDNLILQPSRAARRAASRLAWRDPHSLTLTGDALNIMYTQSYRFYMNDMVTVK